LLVWLSKRASHSDPVELKTDLQAKNMVSASATTASRRLRDADSYASNPETKYLIQEKNRMGRFEFPQKYRPMDIQGLSQSTPEL
jgi:Transposase